MGLAPTRGNEIHKTRQAILRSIKDDAQVVLRL